MITSNGAKLRVIRKANGAFNIKFKLLDNRPLIALVDETFVGSYISSIIITEEQNTKNDQFDRCNGLGVVDGD